LTGKTHISTGIFVTLIAIYSTNIDIIPVVAGSIIGSTLPDIDHPLPHVKHRGITHTLMAAMLIFLSFYLIKDFVLLGLGIGYLTHVLMDLLNGSGCPILYPVYKKRINIIDLKYDSTVEHMIAKVMIANIVVMIVLILMKKLSPILS
jgi:inner membrane protein